MKNQKGQAAILIIFVLGMVSVLIGLSLVKTGFGESLMGRSEAASAKAFYAANSGVEEAFYQIGQNSSLGVGSPATLKVPVADGEAKVTVSGTEDEKTIESVGVNGRYVRKLKVEVQNTLLKPGFLHAIFAGTGGIELKGNTTITADSGPGDVYSIGEIKGAKNGFKKLTEDCTKESPAFINGNAYTESIITQLDDNGSGVCVKLDAYATKMDYCYIEGNAFTDSRDNTNCPARSPSGSKTFTKYTLPDMVTGMKNYLANKHDHVFKGHCIADGSGDSSDCSFGHTFNGYPVIGNLIIYKENENPLGPVDPKDGSLEMPSGTQKIYIDGPIYTEGEINFNSGGDISPIIDNTGKSPLTINPMIVSENKIINSSNTKYLNVLNKNGEKVYLLLISTYPSSDCITDSAINVHSNNDSVLFYAQDGCTLVNSNSDFHGSILGKTIRVEQQSIIRYDPDLANAKFTYTPTGGWITQSFKEE